jgi:hypothetical protein
MAAGLGTSECSANSGKEFINDYGPIAQGKVFISLTVIK